MTADPETAASLVAVIHSGDIDSVERIVADTPELARGPLGGRFKTRTALHVVADWPGYFPNGPDRSAPHRGWRRSQLPRPRARLRTPLHWAATSDDVDVAAALIDGGADIEVPDGSIGTPLDNAIGYGCWNVAPLLVARGARVDKLWHAGSLGRRRPELGTRLRQRHPAGRGLRPWQPPGALTRVPRVRPREYSRDLRVVGAIVSQWSVREKRSDESRDRGGTKMAGKSAHVKNEKQYEALKDKGMSKERAAKIANSPDASSKGGKKSHSGSSRSSSSQGGTTAQKKAAGAKGGRATARKSS